MKNQQRRYLNNLQTTVCGVSLMLAACQRPMSENEATAQPDRPNTVTLNQEQLNLMGLVCQAATWQPMSHEVSTQGMLDLPPQSKISISLPYGGFLKSTPLLPGSRVRKGQVLAVVENPDFILLQQDYLESLGKRSYLQAEWERQRELYDENVASTKSYQQAESDYRVNEARLAGTHTQLQ